MASVLIIDDDAGVRDTVRRILVRGGYEVREAADGEGGIESVHKALPDLVIVDLIMPQKEGIETILELRGAYPDLRILAVSGGGHVGEPKGPLADAKVFGADGALEKPFTIEALERSVATLLAPGDEGSEGLGHGHRLRV